MKFHSREEWELTQPKDKGANSCSFCKQLKGEAKEYIIWQCEHWYVCHNKYPVLGITNQIMAIPKRHVKMAYELTTEEMVEYPVVEKFVYDFYKGGSYFTFMRESIQNRSLEHIHYHFLPGKISYNDLEYMLKKQGF